MKKLIPVVLLSTLMVFPCNIMAAITVNEYPYINDEYGFENNYHICYLDYQCFIVPNYFSEKNDMKSMYYLHDEDKDITLLYGIFDANYENAQSLAANDTKLFRELIVENEAEELFESSLADLREAKTRTYDCTLGTAYNEDSIHMLKLSCMYDPYTMNIYVIAFMYRTEDDEKYSEDFYKIIYSDPFNRSIESIE